MSATLNQATIPSAVITGLEPTLDTPFGPLIVPSQIKSKWDSLTTQTTASGDTVQQYLGWPLREVHFSGGTAVYFERGMIVLRADGRCFTVCGEIYLRYAAFGDVQPTGWSPGLPISDEEAVTNGRRSQFDGADIYWSPSTDAHEVHGAIRDHWQALGGVDGFLGYPLTDETTVTNAGSEIGRMNLFLGGSIYWSSGSGAFEVHGDLRRAWLERFGGPTGQLGWPISDESSSPSGNLRYNDFQHGVLVWPGSYDGIRMLTGFDVYLARLDSRGSHTTAESLGLAGVWLYVNTSVSTSTSGNVSQRFPSSDHYGANATPHTTLMTINPVRGSTTIDVSFDGWDAVAIGSDVHLGHVTEHFDLDSLFNNPGPQEFWNGDFFAAYAVRDLTPANPMDANFRQDLFWGFLNFDTAVLTKEQFGQTFTDVQGDESGWHPFDSLFYDNVYKGIAANGNCFGMCLEANDALARKALYSESIHPVPDSPTSRNEIEIKHGYQVGASVIDYVIGHFFTGGTHDPVRCFNESRDMYNRNDFPIISITNASIGGSGHAVRPYRWDQSNPNDWVIFIANPNEPAPMGSDGDGQNTIHINPNNNTFSFAFSGSETWTGGAWSGGRMFALPFSVVCEEPRTPFWEALLALIGGSIFILAGDATTQQITDGEGRSFYNTPAGVKPTLWEHINESALNRIPGLARVPFLHKQQFNRMKINQVDPALGGVTQAAGTIQTPAGQTAAGQGSAIMGGQISIDPGVIGPILASLNAPVPELYRLEGVRPFGPSPADAARLQIGQSVASAAISAGLATATAQPSPSAGKGSSFGISEIAAGSPAAGSLQMGPGRAAPAMSMEQVANQGDISSTLVPRTGPVDQLTHEVAPGAGAYTWAIRSAGSSAAAGIPGGATTNDLLSLSKPGASEQAISVKLGTSPQPRPVSLTLVNSASAGADKIRTFKLTNVALQPGQAFTANLTADGSQIVLDNAGGQVTLALEIQAGLGPTAMVSRPAVTLQAGKAAIIQPDSWDPIQIGSSPVTMSILDKVGGTVIQQVKIQ